MKSKLAVAPLLTSLCYASPLQPAKNELAVPRQAPGSYFAITGATGGVQPRMEIRDLQRTGVMWNLYLLAMTDFQAMDQNDIASWFQIAGIHGMPWAPWDGVTGSIDGKTEYQRGYCPHNQVLFGTWHRPYLALFEQQLQKVAIGIAKQFPTPTRSTYQDAASKLRIPFWDWAKALPTSEPVLPTALTDEKVQVTFPNGTATQIDNPLYDYNFHPLDHSQINGTGCPVIGTPNGPVGGLPSVCDNDLMTVRRGENSSNHPELNDRLRSILPTQRSNLLKILSQWQPFNLFSNDGSCPGDGRVGTLESLHNPIHTLNWPGHMSPVSVSAFDPMFWMHHANVDRQMALYQAVFPETYVETCPADTPTYTIETGDVIDANSPLTPFHINAAGDWWTSANSRDIKVMNYTYPELASNPSNATLVANIKAQYSGPPDQPVTSKTKRQSTTPSKGLVYLAEVKLPLYGLSDDVHGSSPYDVLVFLGDVPSDAKQWANADSFIGITSTLGGLNMKGEQISTATIDLSLALQKAGKKADNTTADYIKQHLHWRVGLGDKEIQKNDVKGLEVSLISTVVEIATSNAVFDRWVGGFQRHGSVDA